MRSAVQAAPGSEMPRPRRCDGCVDGVLLLHHHPVRSQSRDVIESVRAFRRHSRFPVFTVNTRLGFPPGLAGVRFRAVVLHYTLFYAAFEPFSALFQDEQAYTRDRFALCERYAIDSVYTLLAPAQFDDVYGRYTRVPRIVSHHPGYVSEHLVATAARMTKPDAERRIDVGYRGRLLPAHWGATAREKYDIAVGFRRHATGLGLALDIETAESKRIYGSRWYAFMADCRAVLGTESGASRFDLAGAVPVAAHELPAVADAVPETGGEGEEIPYRTISPRHLEAASLRVCQILFEGRYAGVMEPMVHYIPLRKDFSNFAEVIARFRDRDLRAEIAERAYRDLIASGDLSYAKFVAEVDAELAAAGVSEMDTAAIAAVRRQVYPPWAVRRARTAEMAVRDAVFPGRPAVNAVVAAVRRARHGASTP
jgi:hypothetical protein